MFDHEVDAQNFEVDMKTNEEVLKGKNTTENENGEQKYYRGGGCKLYAPLGKYSCT